MMNLYFSEIDERELDLYEEDCLEDFELDEILSNDDLILWADLEDEYNVRIYGDCSHSEKAILHFITDYLGADVFEIMKAMYESCSAFSQIID